MTGEDLVRSALKMRGMSVYQLSRIMGESRQNYTRLLGHKKGSDMKFEKVSKIMEALGYRIIFEDTLSIKVSKEYIDYLMRHKKPTGVFVAEEYEGSYELHNAENRKELILHPSETT